MKHWTKLSIFALFIVGIGLGWVSQKMMDHNRAGIFVDRATIRPHFSPEEFPADQFVQHFYGLVFALQRGDQSTTDLLTLYFTQDIREKVARILAKDHSLSQQENPEVGCLNFNIFLNTQEVFQGFVVGSPREISGNLVHVPVTFYFSPEQRASQLTVVLNKKGKVREIQNLLYSETESLLSVAERCEKR